MTCKDCIYFDVCVKPHRREFYDEILSESSCRNFKDCSKIIELPCAVGDTVYKIQFGQVNKYTVDGFCKNDKYWDCVVRLVTGMQSMTASFIKFSGEAQLYGKFFAFAEFGNTVFLTKEEAEQALKEQSDE